MRIESGNDKPIFKNLQALRGIAALMVCAYHYSYLIAKPWSEMAFSHGWLGVQIFFMISGFIMVHTTFKIQSNYLAGAKVFFLNRIIRIVPLYYLCTFLMIAPGLNDGYLVEQGRRLILSLLFILPMTSFEGPEYGMPSLDVGWSLNYEMLFYVIFTISILLRKLKYVFLYIIFIIAVFVIPIWQSGSFPKSYQNYIPYSFSYLNVLTNPILLHFLVGITFGLVIKEIKMSRALKTGSLILSSSLFLVYLTGLAGLPFSLWNDLIFCGILVFSFLLNDFGKNGFQFHWPLVKIGDMSYSIYLLHPIIIIYLKFLFNRFGWGPQIPTTGFFVFAMASVIVCSFLFYSTVETRLTHFLKRKFTT